MYVPGKGPGLHLSGARGPRLKSLDLPLRVCIYIRTYILTVARTCSCAEPVWSLSDPVLSCFFYASRLKALFAASTTSTVHSALPCPALQRTTHTYCTALYCTVLYRGPPAFAVCAAVYHYTTTDPGLIFCRQYTDCTQTLSCPSCPVLFCPLSRISDQPPGTNPARRRASK